MTSPATPLSQGIDALQLALRTEHLTICAAESCTGGLICAALTEVSGSSDYFLGGIVTYANEAKVAQLGVREATLREHGAVSREVAEEMVRGARARFGADVALSATGVAGPGGDGEKPVGLTFIACAVGDLVEVRQYNWTGDRAANRAASVAAALDLAAETLLAQQHKTV